MHIQIENIKKSYCQGETPLLVLKGVNLTVQPGEYISIMGSSGSGKSTLMHILGCLDKQFEGDYVLDDVVIRRLSSEKLAEIRRNKIGFIFQMFNLISKLTARENVGLPLVYNRVKLAKGRAEMLLEKVGLSHRLNHFPNQLSGGERQRVAVARALVNNPGILMADEPTGNLDSVSGVQIMQMIDQLNQEGKTIILVTHDRTVAEHAKKIIHIKDGTILKIEKRENFKDYPREKQ